MKTRAEVTIKGDVQKVGFRSFVKDKAESLGLTGCSSNLPNKSVMVVCEGEETDVREFIDLIKKSPFDVKDTHESYCKPTGEFKGFERIGEDVPREDATLGDVIKVLKSFDNKAEQLVRMQSETKEELGEKLDNLGGKIDTLGDNLGGKIDILGDNLGGKIDTIGDNLGGKIDTIGDKTDRFHQDMSDRFSILDDKYGIMAEMVKPAVEGIKETNKNTGKILSRMEKQQENQNQIIEKLISAMIETKK